MDSHEMYIKMFCNTDNIKKKLNLIKAIKSMKVTGN